MILCGIVCTLANKNDYNFLFDTFNEGFFNAVPIILDYIKSGKTIWPNVDCVIEPPFDQEIEFKIECRKHYGEENVFPLLKTPLEETKDKLQKQFVEPIVSKLRLHMNYSAIMRYLVFRSCTIGKAIDYTRLKTQFLEVVATTTLDSRDITRLTGNVYVVIEKLKKENVIDRKDNVFRGVDADMLNFFVKNNYPLSEEMWKNKMQANSAPYYMPKAFNIDTFLEQLAVPAPFVPPQKETIPVSDKPIEDVRFFLEQMDYSFQTSLADFSRRLAQLEEKTLTEKKLDASVLSVIDKVHEMEKLLPNISNLSPDKLAIIKMAVEALQS